MSFTVGIYDVFAYTLPGFLYIYIIYAFISRIEGFRLAQLTLPTIPDGYGLLILVLFLVLAYMLGHLFDVFAHWFVFRLFRSHKFSDAMLERTKKLHADLDIRFKPKDRGLLFSMLRQRNIEHAHIIDSFEATSIMLRNISLGSFLLALLQIPSIFLNLSMFSIAVVFGLLVISIVARKRSQMFHAWSITEIFESSLRYGNSLNEVLAYDREDRAVSLGKQTKQTLKKKRQ